MAREGLEIIWLVSVWTRVRALHNNIDRYYRKLRRQCSNTREYTSVQHGSGLKLCGVSQGVLSEARMGFVAEGSLEVYCPDTPCMP